MSVVLDWLQCTFVLHVTLFYSLWVLINHRMQDVFPNPQLIFALLLATLVGTTHHFIAGGNLRRLVISIVGGWFGFTIGQLISMTLQDSAFMVGQINVMYALSGSILSIVLIHFISLESK
jgi:uncharacterized membrane protein YeaQ/YmgE (transglycosylase-associated protein family)